MLWEDIGVTEAEKADNKIYFCEIQIKKILFFSKDWRANCEESDEVAHFEPPHLDQSCEQFQFELFPSLVL